MILLLTSNIKILTLEYLLRGLFESIWGYQVLLVVLWLHLLPDKYFDFGKILLRISEDLSRIAWYR